MLIGGIVLGLLLGLAAGGNLLNLSSVRLRWVGILLIAVIVRFATEAALSRDIDIAQTLRIPLFAIAFGLLLVGLWVNRRNPGLGLAFVGILLNAIAIAANGGFMPVWIPSLLAAGFSVEDITSPFHIPVGPELDLDFLLQAGPLGDILPVPLPFVRNVASVGDLFLTIGLGFFLFASVVRSPSEPDIDIEPQWPEGGLDGLAARTSLTRAERAAFLQRRIRPATGLAPGLRDAATLERPQLGGASAPGLSAPSTTASIALAPLLPADADAGGLAAAGALELPTRPAEPVAERVRRHPYVRLALNGSFSALWAGQLISLFGDRVHTIALSVLVFNATGSYLAVAGVFFAATLPNLLLSPIAGTFVDRWDQRDVMVVSDLLRAATVLIVPIAAVTSIALVYPLLFLLTSISIFFRPARVAVLPRIVREDELLPANSAMWIGETLADVVGYPLAGVFVAFLGAALPLAFWLDAATYAASAALILTVVVPPLPRDPSAAAERPTVRADLQAGYRFLRGQPTLFANTIQAAVAQFTVGVLTALTFTYAATVVATPSIDAGAAFAFLETAIGVGNLVGGFALGLVGANLAKGRLVIAGYTLWGACVVGLAVTGNLGIAVGLMLGSGVANMIFVIPSQTLFQELTPPDMIGRVVGFRFALVFGMTTFAMGVGGVFAELFGIPIVLAISGLVTIAAGLGGLLVPALRDA